MNRNLKGLVERLREAETEQDISDLLTEGDHYDEPDGKTRRRWQKVAKKRRRELSET